MVFVWFGWFWPLLVRLPKAPTPDHQILMVFDGFGGFGFVLVVLVVWPLLTRLPGAPSTIICAWCVMAVVFLAVL